MSEDGPQDEFVITLDFTSEVARDWKSIPDFYAESPLSPANNGPAEGFVPNFKAIRPEDYSRDLIHRYAAVLQREFQQFVDRNEISGWTPEQLSRIAQKCIDSIEEDILSTIRPRALSDATEQELWGVERYHYVEKEVAEKTVEQIGAEQIRALIDLRFKYQLEIADNQSVEHLSKTLETQFNHEPALARLADQVNAGPRAIVKSVLISQQEEVASQFADLSLELLQENDVEHLEEIAQARFETIFQNSIHQLDIPGQIAVIVGARDQDKQDTRHIQSSISKAINTAQEERDIIRPGRQLARDTSLTREQAEYLLQTIVPASTTRATRKPGFAADAGKSSASEPTRGRRLTADEIHNLPAVEEREGDERQLFLISAASGVAFRRFQKTVRGKPNSSIQKSSGLVDGFWGASSVQQSAIDRMARGDHVLFYRDGEYFYHARVYSTRKDPETMAQIWPETEIDEGDISEYPYLILLFGGEPVAIDSEQLNTQLGYTSPTPPAYWGVATRRTRRVKSVYNSLESFIKSFVE